MSPASLALQADSLLLIHQGSTDITIIILNVNGLNAPTKRHILIELTKIKYKEQVLKAAREKQQITYKGILLRLTVDFPTETLRARREWEAILTVIKGKKPYNQDYSF